MLSAKTLIASIALLGSIQAAPVVQKRSTSGRGTFYDVGMGNCGWYSSANQYVVALNTAQYGSTSQVSGACGQTVTINYNGKSAQAQIVDSCPTCPYGALDMSTSLFSYLTNGNMGLGEIQMSWSWGSGGGSGSGSGSGSDDSSNNNNNNNNNKQNNDAAQQSSSSSSSTPTPTPTSTSSASSSSSTSSVTPTSTASAAVPTGNANTTVTGVPQWWAQVGNDGCSIAVPEGVATAGIAPYTNSSSNLAEQCGKWIEIINPANNKTTKAMVSTWLPGSQENSLVLGDAYKQVADMNGDVPNPISEVKWGFI